MKRIISLILAGIMLISFAACDEETIMDEDDEDNDHISQTTDEEDTVIRGKINTMDANTNFIVAVKQDGTVLYTGGTSFSGNISTQSWKDVIKVSVGGNHIVALTSSGSVYAAGYTKNNRCQTQDWTDIIDVHAGYDVTVGLKSDGTVIATGGATAFEKWKDIASLSGYGDSVYGLSNSGDVYKIHQGAPIMSDVKSIHTNTSFALFVKNDGTVVSDNPDDSMYYSGIEEWTDVADIAMSHVNLSAGLMSDGTVKLIGLEKTVSQCDVSGWTDIVAVAVGDYHVVGLKSDGSVVATGTNGYGQCDVSEWKDIVAIWANDIVTIGLTENGKVVIAGRFKGETCDAETWTGVKTN